MNCGGKKSVFLLTVITVHVAETVDYGTFIQENHLLLDFYDSGRSLLIKATDAKSSTKISHFLSIIG